MNLVVEDWRVGIILFGFILGMWAGLFYDMLGKFGFISIAILGVACIWVGLNRWGQT